MTKKLEDLLNLAPADKVEEEKVTEQQDVIPVPDAETYQNAMSKADKIDAALPMVENLEASDGEMDDIADTAKDTFKDLMDLGMNVDSRYSGRIFEVASTMLRNAIDAKSNKIDRKLKMVELQLKKMKLDKDGPDDNNEAIDSEGTIITDRNELMKKLMKKD